MDCFVASLLAMTKESPLAAEFQLSTGPQHFGPVADHLRLLRQRDGGRQQDHQRLGAEDRGREIEAYFRAIKPADDGAERGAERARPIAHDVDGGYPPQ